MRVLIVDDDSDQRHLLAEAFTAIGWVIVALARDAEEATHLAAHNLPDAIVVDPVLPGYTAEQSLVRLSQHAPRAVLVAFGTPCERRFVQSCRQAGADLYVLKSQGAADVARRTHHAFGNHRTSSPTL
jgi:DNA-binding NarL/FixJ family response regulator